MNSFRQSAWALSIFGLLPFVIPTVWIVFSNQDAELISRAEFYLATYGAIILSFLGGVRWGHAIAIDESSKNLFLSVVPSLVAWFSLWQETHLYWLALAFFLQWVWDVYDVRRKRLPKWFGVLRTVISAIVVVLLIAAFNFSN